MKTLAFLVVLGLVVWAVITVMGINKRKATTDTTAVPAVPAVHGVGARTGAAVDRAVEDSKEAGKELADDAVAAAKTTAAAAKDVAGRVVEKTGKVL